MQLHPARRLASVLATLVGCFLLIGLFTLQMRYEGVESGLVSITPVDAAAASVAPLHASGASAGASASAGAGANASTTRTITAPYCSEVVATSDPSNPSGRTSTQMTFDDAWFSRDSHTYQHELATACSVLAAVCNSESQYYDGVPGAIPYAEQTLGQLGFHDVRTASYALRSSVVDEMGSLLAGSSDVAAYTLASKTIADQDGQPATLLFVGIRGTYGAEWLSNFNFLGPNPTELDHHGFKQAEEEVEEAVREYARGLGIDPERTRILITGHSRGGAIANLLAADLNTPDSDEPALAPSSGIYAYTFAAPCATRALDRHDRTYGNIFNVVNEADIVPQLPLSAWGFGRYGTKITLPSATSSDFDDSFATMQTAFHRNTGNALGCDEDTLEALYSFGADASSHVPQAEDLFSPLGIFGVVQSFAGLDVLAALNAHYPDTYIAWMQAVDIAHTATT